MPKNHIGQVLDDWANHYVQKSARVKTQIEITAEDDLKLDALAELFHIPKVDILSNLLSKALLEAEERMPYRAGTKVIRMEEGDPIYEDIGPMPRYLEIKESMEKARINKTTTD